MTKSDRSNGRQRREAGRLIELQVKRDEKGRRRPVSLDEFGAMLRMAGKATRAKRRNARADDFRIIE